MNLKDDKPQNIQKQLDFSVAPTSEAREAGREETESSGAKNESEKPASTDRMMEEICEWENLKDAMWLVKANKGSAGIDGMTVDELPDYARSACPLDVSLHNRLRILAARVFQPRQNPALN